MKMDLALNNLQRLLFYFDVKPKQILWFFKTLFCPLLMRNSFSLLRFPNLMSKSSYLLSPQWSNHTNAFFSFLFFDLWCITATPMDGGRELWHIDLCRLFNAKQRLWICIKFIWFGLVGFYSISTIVGHLMLNHPLSLSIYIYIYIYMCVCVCVCVCDLLWLCFIAYQPV